MTAIWYHQKKFPDLSLKETTICRLMNLYQSILSWWLCKNIQLFVTRSWTWLFESFNLPLFQFNILYSPAVPHQRKTTLSIPQSSVLYNIIMVLSFIMYIRTTMSSKAGGNTNLLFMLFTGYSPNLQPFRWDSLCTLMDRSPNVLVRPWSD